MVRGQVAAVMIGIAGRTVVLTVLACLDCFTLSACSWCHSRCPICLALAYADVYCCH